MSVGYEDRNNVITRILIKQRGNREDQSKGRDVMTEAEVRVTWGHKPRDVGPLEAGKSKELILL